MRSAYNEEGLNTLTLVKEAKRWRKQDWITKAQSSAISDSYKSPFYHPNFIIRMVLFIATLIALSGVTGLFLVFLNDIGEVGLSVASVAYGVGSFFFMKKVFIEGSHHYKSGVTEALLYHACGYTLAGLGNLTDFNPHLMIVVSLLVFSFAAIRYLDLISTLAAMVAFAGLLFYEFYNMGGIFQQIIPFLFIACFTPLYWFAKRLKKKKECWIWNHNLMMVESVSLLLIYLAGNYLVVRELSVNMMNLNLEPGENIPFAWIFYGLTVMLPMAYLFFGIKNKDVILLRVSLVLFACSVLTFKYYYSFGHPEISLTIAGAILLAIALALFNYLKINRNGFTRENLLAEKWGDVNIQAFIISQTLGGNQVTTDGTTQPCGGEFSGGGASGGF